MPSKPRCSRRTACAPSRDGRARGGSTSLTRLSLAGNAISPDEQAALRLALQLNTTLVGVKLKC